MLDFLIFLEYYSGMKTFKKLITTLLTANLLFLAIFGLNLSVRLMEDGPMANCQFMQEKSSMCPMNLVDHIAAWQNTLTGTLTASLFLILLVAVAAFASKNFNLGNSAFLSFTYYYKKKNSLLKYFIPMRLAYARGIIQPKVY